MARYNREQIPAQLTPEQAEQFRRTPTTGLPLHVLNRLPRINAADLDADIADAPSILQHRDLPVRGPNKSPWISQHSVKPAAPTRTFSEGLRLGKAMVIVGALAVSSFTDAMAEQSASMLEELERQQQEEIAFERAVISSQWLPTEGDLALRGIRQAAAGRGDDLEELDRVREQVDDVADARPRAGEEKLAEWINSRRAKPIGPGLRPRAGGRLAALWAAVDQCYEDIDYGDGKAAIDAAFEECGVLNRRWAEMKVRLEDQTAAQALIESQGQEVAITINFDHQRQPTRETQLTETDDGRLLVSVLPDDSWGYQQQATTTGGRQVLLTAPASAEEIKAAGGATPGPIDPPPQLPAEAIGELAAASTSDYARFN